MQYLDAMGQQVFGCAHVVHINSQFCYLYQDSNGGMCLNLLHKTRMLSIVAWLALVIG